MLALGAARGQDGARLGAEEALRLAGEALSAGSDEGAVAEQVARLAAEASGAAGCLLWLIDEAGGDPVLVAVHGLDDSLDHTAGAERVARVLSGQQRSVASERVGEASAGVAGSTILPLGQPPLGAVELLFEDGREERVDATRLASFGARAAHALRASARARRLDLELERSRALLEVIGQAFAELSLAHTLETAVERVAELLAADRVALYLRADGALEPAAGRGVTGPHGRVAERLLELMLRSRERGLLAVEDARADPLLEGVWDEAAEAGIEAAVAVALGVQDEVIGLLALYPEHGRRLSANEETLLRALAVQLAVAVQNAQLHERETQLRDELEVVLTAERQSARQVRALYEISHSFVQSLSLDATLDALATSVVELLGVDAVVIHVPDERRELLRPSALKTRDPSLRDALSALLYRPLVPRPWPRRQARRAIVVDAARARRLGEAGEALATLLEQGCGAALVPVAAPADPVAPPSELLATMLVLSLDPQGPLDAETIELARTVAGQAAFAVDNARLYHQQKSFADTMQRLLLPRERPHLEGLELGDVYAPSARLEVGGDVYDYAVLDDGRLAVVLGDVTGHGVEATADMAMTTFVFRSVSREHPEPGDFLAHANEVVVDEVAAGKFVTMVYLTVDPATGEVACAVAGHPPPRIVSPDGSVRKLAGGGLPLGIEEAQVYAEVRDMLEPGAAVVLYTDGVIEARRDRELYGEERLDALLAARVGLAPTELAEAVLEDCRAFGGGELTDDCAVVVILRT